MLALNIATIKTCLEWKNVGIEYC